MVKTVLKRTSRGDLSSPPSIHLANIEDTPPRASYGSGRFRSNQRPLGILHAPSGSYIQVGDPNRSLIEGSSEIIAAYNDDGDIDQGNKKVKQWQFWQDRIIPELVPVYMRLYRETVSLSRLHEVRNSILCPGCENGRIIPVSCIFFDRMSLFHLPDIFLILYRY
jgi:hypothetical protein